MVVSHHHPGYLGAASAPVDVVRQYATEHGYEVTVMGQPSSGTSVPVLVGPMTR